MKTIEVPAAKREVVLTRIPERRSLHFPKVSAVLITYNEEKNIRRTLTPLHWCDEIIIVDSFSTDNTVSICKEFGCKIFYQKFDGYGRQKRFAVSKASNDWVLCIDADEVLTTDLVQEISDNISPTTEYAGFAFPMNMVFLNKEFLHGKESGRYYVRLFNKQKGNFTDDKIHEGISLKGSVKRLHHIIRHYSYTSLHQYMEKFNRYSTYSAEVAFDKGKNKSFLEIVLALPFNFVKYYFLDLNFLNGIKGFYWSALSTYYYFVKYVKLKELYRAHKNQETAIHGFNGQ
jgi:glycosyltransferase involved in cell wall biosynthesis